MGGPVMHIELEIEGVPDRAIADAIRKRVRKLRQQVDRQGDWRVTIAPSETRGQRDVGIRTPSGWQLASFDEPVEELPATHHSTIVRVPVRFEEGDRLPIRSTVQRFTRRDDAVAAPRDLLKDD
jgi:hypothetical protein